MSRASVTIARISSSEFAPSDQYARMSTVREPDAVVELARHRDRARAHDRAALEVALEVERAREPAEQPDSQLRVLVAERLGGLLEQLDGAEVGHAGSPARVLVADRRAGEQARSSSSRAMLATAR